MNHRAFTLIELLVVVAIIGILAAVGVVAYNGYTKSAKVNAAKSNFATVVKYIASEMKKCELDIDTIFDGNLTCSKFSTSNMPAVLISNYTAMVLNKKLENPRLGSRRCNGICPPSNPGRVGRPERDFWPLMPKPQLAPCPAAMPLPLRSF